MSQRVDYAHLPTEQPNPKGRQLDRLSLERILHLINEEDHKVPRQISPLLPEIARAVRVLVESWKAGGRWFFIGAGTSGRLGVIEAAECPPTFNTPPHRVQAIIAGGPQSVFQSKEGAEDNRRAAHQEVHKRVSPGDVVIGIAASGVTPFVDAGLVEAKARGAATILVTCYPGAGKHHWVDITISPQVGPEVIAGSTRLKAGTATKLVLNMLTVAAMVQLGKVYGHWMVDVRPSSQKLRARAVRIIRDIAGVTERQAMHALQANDGQVKAAIVMSCRKISALAAQRLLQEHGGVLRDILPSVPSRRKKAAR